MMRESGVAMAPRADFVPTRRPAHWFRELDAEGKNRVIEKDPAYAHVICRCETVTEGEIREAARQNPRPTDLDGLKRRTRAMMGRCQGGFCTPSMVQILAEERGTDPLQITKSGGASRINLMRIKEEGLGGVHI